MKKRCDIDHFHATGIIGKKAISSITYEEAMRKQDQENKQVHNHNCDRQIHKYTEIQMNTQIHKYMQRQQIVTCTNGFS